jgi:hypothetical protein
MGHLSCAVTIRVRLCGLRRSDSIGGLEESEELGEAESRNGLERSAVKWGKSCGGAVLRVSKAAAARLLSNEFKNSLQNLDGCGWLFVTKGGDGERVKNE